MINGLNTLFTGRNLLQLKETASTNEDASVLIENHPPDGTLIITENQTAGKGTSGNKWLVHPGENLTFSIIYYPTGLKASEVFLLNQISSLAVMETICIFLPDAEVSVKWPNDVMIGGIKCCGILIENQLKGERIRSAIIGIGLNVNQEDFPDELKDKAVSMSKIAGRKLDKEAVLANLLSQMEKYYLMLNRHQYRQIRENYLEKMWKYREEVDFEVDGKQKKGMIEGIDLYGRLIMRMDGQQQAFQQKEIRFL